jgi:hypothetical protein
VLDALAKNVPPLLTVGQLAEWCRHPDNLLTDVRGIGDAKAEAIHEALDRFWAGRTREALAAQEVDDIGHTAELDPDA